MSKEGNIHAGHRERVINTVSRVGLSDLSSFQIMEFILFYIFPRGDVNPLAHRLLDKFKSVSHVIDASLSDLMAVKGMGETSAKKLKAMVEIFDAYVKSKANKNEGIDTFGEIYDYAEMILRYKNVEELYVFGFDSRHHYVADRCLARGKIDAVNIDMMEISNFVSSFKVPIVYIAHNHPGGSCEPSIADINAYKSLTKKFEFTGCVLADSFIVGSEGVFSLKDGRKKRIFCDSGDCQDFVEILAPNRKQKVE